MNEKVIHSFEGICPLTTYGIYGIKKKYEEKKTKKIFLKFICYFSFNMPNFPCADNFEQLSLKKHLMYKHNLSNTAGMKFIYFYI